MGDFYSESFKAVVDGFMNVNNLKKLPLRHLMTTKESQILKQTCNF